MEKYKLKDFHRWAKKEGLSNNDLLRTSEEMSKGLLGDRLGAYIFKKRIGIANKGKRSGLRTIIVYRDNEFAIFIYGYAKNEKSDLEPKEQAALRIFAKELIKLSKVERMKKEQEGILIKIVEE